MKSNIKKEDLQWIEIEDNQTEEIITYGLLRTIEFDDNNKKYVSFIDEEFFEEYASECDLDFEIFRCELNEDGEIIFIYIDVDENEEEFDMVMDKLEAIWEDEELNWEE